MGSMIWVTFSNPISTKSWILIYKKCFLKVLVYGLQSVHAFFSNSRHLPQTYVILILYAFIQNYI